MSVIVVFFCGALKQERKAADVPWGGSKVWVWGAPFGNRTCTAGLRWCQSLACSWSYFPCFIMFLSLAFQLYERYGVTMSGVLKRKYEELGDDSTYCSSSSCSPLSSSASSGWDSDEENSRGESKPSSALTPSFTREYPCHPLPALQPLWKQPQCLFHLVVLIYLVFILTQGTLPQPFLPAFVTRLLFSCPSPNFWELEPGGRGCAEAHACLQAGAVAASTIPQPALKLFSRQIWDRQHSP